MNVPLQISNIMKILAISLSLLLTQPTAFADISYTPAKMTGSSSFVVSKIRIFETVSNDDAKQFHLMAEAARQKARSIGLSLEPFPLLVELDSPGGSVNAAIAIGREIRSLNTFSVVVKAGATCVSACVLILAGGVNRTVSGKVGIHRPYVDIDSNTTIEKQKSAYIAIERDVKNYLAEVNVPTNLYDQMFRIPPEKVRYLSERDLQDFNLNESDPFYESANDAKVAQYLGLTKSEYLRRKQYCQQASSAEDAAKCMTRMK